MAVQSQQVSVATTATRLDSTASSSISQESCLIVNQSAVTVYIGGSDVTTGNGLRLGPGQPLTADLQGGESLFGVVASGTATCDVLRAGGS